MMSDTSNADELVEWRKAAAALSHGISHDTIYQMAFKGMGQIPRQARIFEFGSGLGHFLKFLRTHGLENELTGADIMPRPADLAGDVKWLEADLNHPLSLPDRSFDLIAAIEVIEHLENPRATIREMARLLAPGGRLVITTPNQESLRSILSLVLKGHFIAFTGNNYPAHITALLKQDFERILNEAGLKVITHCYTDEGGLPKRPGLKWQKISFGLLKGRWFSDNQMVVAVKPMDQSDKQTGCQSQ
jgi:2-polyprenyl-3-methyl-5-hydroxy-6-metoxy-1,4-benzoquinol methylase